jgi:hypothetical protein
MFILNEKEGLEVRRKKKAVLHKVPIVFLVKLKWQKSFDS